MSHRRIITHFTIKKRGTWTAYSKAALFTQLREYESYYDFYLLLFYGFYSNDVLSYLHSTFSPPLSECNKKAANFLLDEELRPHICDCVLAILRPLMSNVVKIKVSTSRNN